MDEYDFLVEMRVEAVHSYVLISEQGVYTRSVVSC